MPWSVIDADAGGVDVDGLHTVTVQYGNGAAWHSQATADITLDRVAPEALAFAATLRQQTWSGAMTFDGWEDGFQSRWSLDGSAWSAWDDTNAFDIVDSPQAPAWFEDDHTVFAQVRDEAGNESEVVQAVVDVDPMVFSPIGAEGKVGLSFEFPDAAVTGHTFTIRPVYPAGYVKPSDLWCEWTLHWGDDDSILGLPNPSWGELIFERHKSSGACTEWSFTLPNTREPPVHVDVPDGPQGAGRPLGGVDRGPVLEPGNAGRFSGHSRTPPRPSHPDLEPADRLPAPGVDDQPGGRRRHLPAPHRGGRRPSPRTACSGPTR